MLEPDCEPAPRPVLPVIETERMDQLSEDTFWDLMERERLLTDWALENEAVVEALCQ